MTTETPKICTGLRKAEEGVSVFSFYNISYNADYTKYRGVKKPSFPGFEPLRRLPAILGLPG